MTRRSVISYLYKSEVADKDVINSAPFDFRIHENVEVISEQEIACRIFADRGVIPQDCKLDWY